MSSQITPAAGQPGLPPFPVWPPPSGGYPVTRWEVGPIAGTPAPGRTFPAGSYIDGLGTVVTPTRVIGGLGN
jgi:hypothetical protein